MLKFSVLIVEYSTLRYTSKTTSFGHSGNNGPVSN